MCLLGRTHNPKNPICLSCIRQLGQCPDVQPAGRLAPSTSARKQQAVEVEQAETTFRDKTLVTTAYLFGLNKWNNSRDPYAYLKQRRRWEVILANTFALWPRRPGRRELLIVRFVASARNLIKDRDNLVGGAKPIKDVLTRCGVLVDDTDELLHFDVLQEVDKESPRTEITVF